MKKIFCLFLTFLCIPAIWAQYSISGIVKDSLNNPVPFANVYLSNTTIGASTDKDGNYSLPNVVPGNYELSASCLGYTSYSKTILVKDRDLFFNFLLVAKSTSIDEIQINSKDVQVFTDFKFFEKLFLGESIYAQGCTIKNKNDLKLNLIPKKNLIRGHSTAPLLIENKALGYLLTYDLTDFYYDKTTEILKYKGSVFFQPLEGSDRKINRWERNRFNAYKNSKLFFLRATLADATFQKSFKLFHYVKDPNTNEYKAQDPIQISSIRLDQNKDCQTFYYPKPVLIRFANKNQDDLSDYLSYSEIENMSLIRFSDTLKIFSNGSIENPYSITWGGKMMKERVGDLLPVDYNPLPKNENEKITISSKSKSDLWPSNISQEQVFVQTDRNRYHPGDTLFFQSYIKNRFSGVFESSSAALYVLLFNSEHHMVDSARFKINKALCPGWMAIPSSAKAGKYRLVAFTSKMQHYSPEEAFMVDLAVDPVVKDPFNVKVSFSKSGFLKSDTIEATLKLFDPKGKPVSGQKIQSQLLSDSKKIESDHFQTNDLGEATIHFLAKDFPLNHPQIVISTKIKNEDEPFVKTVDVPWEMPQIHLHFLPEGGTLIDNIPQRIGFHATNEKGETIFIKGLLKLDDGTLVDSIRSGEYGPGMFSCKPRKGMYVELLQENNSAQKFPLPEPVSQGICLRVIPFNEHTIAVEILSNKKEPENIHVEGLLQWDKVVSKDLLLDKKEAFLIKTDDLAAGIMDITVYDDKNQPVASRYCMVNPKKNMKVHISIDSISNKNKAESSILLSVTDESGLPQKCVFSLALVDSVKGICSNYFMPDINYTLNENTYLIKNLPSKVLEKGIGQLTSSDKDLMMMIFGWKKYHNEPINPQPPFTPAKYQTELLTINLMTNQKKVIKANHNLLNIESLKSLPLHFNNEGISQVRLDSLEEDTKNILFLPEKTSKQFLRSVPISISTNDEYFKNSVLVQSLPTFNHFNEKESFLQNDSILTFENRVIQIQKVTFVEKKKKSTEFANEYAEKYKNVRIKTLTETELKKYSSVWAILYSMGIQVIKEEENKVYLLNYRTSFCNQSPHGPEAMFVLDGLPLYDKGYYYVKTLDPNRITSISVLKSKHGIVQYGEDARGGVIFINTDAHANPYLKAQQNAQSGNLQNYSFVPFKIYRENVEFYNPSRDEQERASENYVSKPTIVWENQILSDESHPVRISFPKGEGNKKNILIINGFTNDNQELSARFTLNNP